MPSFTGDERVRIEAGLRSAAARLFPSQGLRKTTLDELVAPVGIAKSSFYAFFDSKESLYLDLMLARLDDVRARLPALTGSGVDAAGDLRSLLRQVVQLLDTDPFYRRLVSNPEDMARVAAKLGPDQVADVQRGLLDPLSALIERAQRHGGLVAADPHVVVGVLRAVLLVPLHADEFDPDHYRPVLDLLIDAVATGLSAPPLGGDPR